MVTTLLPFGQLPGHGSLRQLWFMKSSRLLLVLGLSLVAGVSSVRANEVFKFDSSHSTIAFKVRSFLGSAKGRFAKFTGTIEVDRDHPEKSSVVATIQAASIDTANAKRDEHLRTADFFNVQQYPEITFKSRRVKQTGANTGEIAGDFSMHGVTRVITLSVQLLGPAESAARNPTTRWRVTTPPLKRSDFGIGKGATGASMIGDDVTVNIEIEAARAQ
jgi:polyisoprenoid-binding protein YceI